MLRQLLRQKCNAYNLNKFLQGFSLTFLAVRYKREICGARVSLSVLVHVRTLL